MSLHCESSLTVNHIHSFYLNYNIRCTINSEWSIIKSSWFLLITLYLCEIAGLFVEWVLMTVLEEVNAVKKPVLTCACCTFLMTLTKPAYNRKKKEEEEGELFSAVPCECHTDLCFHNFSVNLHVKNLFSSPPLCLIECISADVMRFDWLIRDDWVSSSVLWQEVS